MGYLWHQRILLKEFGKHAEQVTEQIKKASLAEAKRQNRPAQYLPSSKTDKKKLAEQIATRDQVESGLICVLSWVEPWFVPSTWVLIRKPNNWNWKHRLRKCLFLYHYWIHPIFGFMSARIQTWFPFQVQIYLNGREWLAQQMKGEGLKYVRQENCFPWIEDFARAQNLMDDQGKTDWPGQLNAIAQQLNPQHNEMFAGFAAAEYYWSVCESEWAADISFRGSTELQRLFPRLVGTRNDQFLEARM